MALETSSPQSQVPLGLTLAQYAGAWAALAIFLMIAALIGWWQWGKVAAERDIARANLAKMETFLIQRRTEELLRKKCKIGEHGPNSDEDALCLRSFESAMRDVAYEEIRQIKLGSKGDKPLVLRQP